MKLSRIIIAISVVILLFGGIAISNALGFWEITGSKTPQKIQSGEFEGLSNPWDIRGSYTFGDIENAFDIKSEILAEAFGVESSNPETIKVNTLEAIYKDMNFPVEIGTGAVKYFVALYNGLPLDEEAGITTQALLILKNDGKITDEQYTLLSDDAIDLNSNEYTYIPINEDTKNETNLEEEEHGSSTEVTGSTTIEQALDMGISKDVLKEYLGEWDDTSQIIKDLSQSSGFSFGEIKTALNDSINK